MVVLAYVLALGGMLGSIAAGAHISEARTAAQLGVICTIHGIAGAGHGQNDPTPGKLACIEHCVLATANAMPVLPSAGLSISRSDRLDQVAIAPTHGSGHRIAPVSTPPPPRGPPRLI